jgi:hypothetical protein
VQTVFFFFHLLPAFVVFDQGLSCTPPSKRPNVLRQNGKKSLWAENLIGLGKSYGEEEEE